jgi:hypothetical protein
MEALLLGDQPFVAIPEELAKHSESLEDYLQLVDAEVIARGLEGHREIRFRFPDHLHHHLRKPDRELIEVPGVAAFGAVAAGHHRSNSGVDVVDGDVGNSPHSSPRRFGPTRRKVLKSAVAVIGFLAPGKVSTRRAQASHCNVTCPAQCYCVQWNGSCGWHWGCTSVCMAPTCRRTFVDKYSINPSSGFCAYCETSWTHVYRCC